MPSSGGLDNQFFEELARNNTATNIPTLIEILKSKSVLGKLSASNDIFYGKLVKSIGITAKGENAGGGGLAAMRGGGGDAGILEISLNWQQIKQKIRFIHGYNLKFFTKRNCGCKGYVLNGQS